MTTIQQLYQQPVGLTHLLIRGSCRMGLHKAEKSFIAGLKITNETARLALTNLKELVFLRISREYHDVIYDNYYSRPTLF